MLYAILCYHDEDMVGSWSKEHDADVMKKLAVVQDKLTRQGRLGPVARLLPTTAATTLRKDDPPLVLDGPYAETKEQLLGFYVVDCKNLDEALDWCARAAQVDDGTDPRAAAAGRVAAALLATSRGDHAEIVAALVGSFDPGGGPNSFSRNAAPAIASRAMISDGRIGCAQRRYTHSRYSKHGGSATA